MKINELQTKWEMTSPYSGGFLLVSGHHPLSFHVGYFGEQMCFMVLDTGKIDNISSSKAITAKCIQTEDKKYALSFLLNFESLSELFVKLCWDLIDCSRESSKPVDSILSRFNSWIRLLQKKGDGLLSPSSQKGLIGELLFLQDSIKTIGAYDSLNAWVGPEGSDQDFIFSNLWCEIKTTTIASATVSISSLQQLDRDDVGNLVVYFMDKTTSDGTQTVSLPEVIEETNSLLENPHLIDLFSCKLAMCGYYLKDVELYKTIRYRMSEKRSYEVTCDFPRLTRDNVPQGIQNAKYELELSAIEAYRN